MKHCLSVLVASALTVLLYQYETRHSEEHRIQTLLRWSRQVVQQTEALSLYAKEKTEPDPISWAVKYLMVGDDSRLVWVKSYYDTTGLTKSEDFSLSPTKGEFTYSKMLKPETGQGVQLQIHVGYQGFLGTRSIAMNDFSVVLVFLLLFGSLSTVTFRMGVSQIEYENDSRLAELLAEEEAILEKIRDSQPILRAAPAPEPESELLPAPALEPTAPAVSDLKGPVADWVVEAREVLLKVGRNIKAMTHEAKELAVVVANSRETLESARQVSSLMRKTLDDLELAMLQPVDNINEIKEISKVLKQINEKSSGGVDATFTEYERFFDTSQLLNDSISQTTESLLKEAQLFKDLKERILA